ncbi:HNH endonuclease family protein [Duganella sp. PWIR1]
MIISIKGNWSAAEVEHNAYVKAQVKYFRDYYSARSQIDPHFTVFLSDLVKNLKESEIEAALKALSAAISVEASLPAAERPQFRSYLLGNTPMAGLTKARARIKKFNADYHAALALPVFSCRDALEKKFPDPACSKIVQDCLNQEIFAGKKPKNFKLVHDRLNPYIAALPIRSAADPVTVAFLDELDTDIGIADFTELESSIEVLERHQLSLKKVAQRKHFISSIETVFDYDRFIARKSGWNAYSLCSASTSKTCPYCAQAYAFTIYREDDSPGFRPTLDHFLPKHKFPHLALSLGNLIPSCYTCNSNLKNSKDFRAIPHLHPLYDNESFTFELALECGTSLDALSDIKALRPKTFLQLRRADKTTKVKNSASTFLLDRRYVGHLNEALDFSEYVLNLDTERFTEVSGILGGMTIEQLLRFDSKNYRNTIMGKMYLDLFKHFHR